MYLGKVGHTPDFLGFGMGRDIRIAEVKWQAGWPKDLPSQVSPYCDDLWTGSRDNFDLTVHIAATQSPCKGVIRDFLELRDKEGWKNLRFRFGFIQLGWLKNDNTENFLRVLWLPDSQWDGDGFRVHQDDVWLWGD